MSTTNAVDKINNKMVQLSEIIDRDNEAARLQGSVLAGALLGGWAVAGATAFEYAPMIAGMMLTVGVVGGIGARIML